MGNSTIEKGAPNGIHLPMTCPLLVTAAGSSRRANVLRNSLLGMVFMYHTVLHSTCWCKHDSRPCHLPGRPLPALRSRAWTLRRAQADDDTAWVRRASSCRACCPCHDTACPVCLWLRHDAVSG